MVGGCPDRILWPSRRGWGLHQTGPNQPHPSTLVPALAFLGDSISNVPAPDPTPSTGRGRAVLSHVKNRASHQERRKPNGGPGQPPSCRPGWCSLGPEPSPCPQSWGLAAPPAQPPSLVSLTHFLSSLTHPRTFNGAVARESSSRLPHSPCPPPPPWPFRLPVKGTCLQIGDLPSSLL